MCIICREWEKHRITTDEAFRIVKSGEVKISPEHTDKLMNILVEDALGMGNRDRTPPKDEDV